MYNLVMEDFKEDIIDSSDLLNVDDLLPDMGFVSYCVFISFGYSDRDARAMAHYQDQSE